MTHTVKIDESERQALLLAIAKLALERPGWNWMLGNLADKYSGREMFEEFKEMHSAWLARRKQRQSING